MAFFLILKSSALSLLETFLIITLGFLLIRRRVLPDGSVDILSQFIVKVAFPAYIFTHMLGGMDGGGIAYWWAYPLLGVAMILTGMALGLLPVKLDPKIGSPRELLAMNGFQNAGYLPLPLAVALFPDPNPMGRKLVVAIILFISVYNFLMWTLGVFLLSGRDAKTDLKSTLTKAINPPFIAIVFSLIVVQSGLGRLIPPFIISPIRLLGNCTIPVIMIALGGILGEICLVCAMERRTITYLVVQKLLVMPTLALAIVWLAKPPPLIGIVLVMEAAMPPATTLPIVARIYGGNSNTVSQTVFFSYLISIITIPVFMSLALTLLGVAV